MLLPDFRTLVFGLALCFGESINLTLLGNVTLVAMDLRRARVLGRCLAATLAQLPAVVKPHAPVAQTSAWALETYVGGSVWLKKYNSADVQRGRVNIFVFIRTMAT